MKSPDQTHTPTDIQFHLYLSFLHGHTADVALHTKGGSWEAVYQLHRVVLIQAVSDSITYSEISHRTSAPRDSSVPCLLPDFSSRINMSVTYPLATHQIEWTFTLTI